MSFQIVFTQESCDFESKHHKSIQKKRNKNNNVPHYFFSETSENYGSKFVFTNAQIQREHLNAIIIVKSKFCIVRIGWAMIQLELDFEKKESKIERIEMKA